MIRNPETLRKFEDDILRQEGPVQYDRALKMLDSMWDEGVKLGVLPPKDPLEGIEVDVRVARIVNSCLKKPSPG